MIKKIIDRGRKDNKKEEDKRERKKSGKAEDKNRNNMILDCENEIKIAKKRINYIRISK